jgi:1-acyl-sn-glycerol-3-phosphate acyltransferase
LRHFLRLFFRLSGFFAALAVLVPPQILLMHVPRYRFVLPQLFFRIMLALLSVRVSVTGPLPDNDGKTGTLLVANHVSWFDVALMGAVLPVAFMAKSEVKTWPLFGQLAWLNNALFITRRIGRHTLKERQALAARLARGEKLVLFAEGTSSDGMRVLPFKSSFLSVPQDHDDIGVQAVTLAYTRRHDMALGRRQRMAYGWIGDMTLLPHFLKIFAGAPLSVELLFHEALPPACRQDRKAMARLLPGQVSQGLQAIMQGRPHPVAALSVQAPLKSCSKKAMAKR